ncbi:hypothetical protein QBC38DRAFT_461360 [Podospora fimiseda]|uniref:Uncharacterized protein n=1 Tax=Podospora fimiseda TaxID=252190 RepID=A0AAN6YND8_9PEZI|nr:hypothetical protein QBC38DRAFT_461360 [Podospora fimiseda]
MANIPAIHVDDENAAGKIAHLVPYLCQYQHLYNLTGDKIPARCKFTVQKISRASAQGSTAQRQKLKPRYQIEFSNTSTSSCSKQYLTILNLQPGYGVTQLVPPNNEESMEVISGKSIPPRTVAIIVTELLAAASSKPGFKMRDTFIALVTDRPTSFEDYI